MERRREVFVIFGSEGDAKKARQHESAVCLLWAVTDVYVCVGIKKRRTYNK